ncbi:hypothetical protein GIB67_015123 [Kingdonia uniflora]|uniref:Aminotransferase-like plant mobile domain-containing protein n=1 Tax=Kingdonia uniflora TaxID=39325 RepID=A0A7J7LJ18_9MAGN|nr:hypothetical protein GIB67_015123 [Kingdonia uniflora]
MPEGEPHRNTLPGFRRIRDPERSITRLRSGRKKKRVKFEDVQPQDIPNPTEDNFPRRCITQLPDGVSRIYYTGKELTNWDSMRVHGTFTTVFKVWKDIATLPAVRDAVVNIFGQFMDIRLGNLDNRQIQALTERWWPTAHTFMFPCAKIGVTPLDFTMLTSLPIARYPTQVPYDDVWYILSNTRQLLPNIDSNHIKSGNVNIAHLKTYLTVEIHREDDITIARAFILFMMGYLWFQTANDTVQLGYLAVVNDLDLTPNMTEVLLFLLPCTMVWIPQSQPGVPSLDLCNFFRYVNTIGSTSIVGLAYPRLRAWERGNRRKTNDLAANFFIIGRYHIDHRSVETITWEPWFDSAVSKTKDVLNVTGEVRIPLDPPLSMSPHISPATLHEMRQAGFVDREQFVVGEVRETYASYWAEQILEDIILPGEAEGPDLGWRMQWTGRRENLPIACLRDSPPMSSSYGTEELWHLTHGMRRLILAESARDAKRIQEVEEELAIARRQIDSIDHQLYAHDLQLRRGRDVRVVPLTPGGGARTRQRRSCPRTRGGNTSRRGRGTGDDSE